MVSVSFATTKASLVVDQECPIRFGKRFEFRGLSRGDCLVLLPIAGIKGLARRRSTMRIRWRGRRTIKIGTIVAGGRGGNEIVTWRQCLFDAQRATDKVVPSFLLAGWLRNDEFLDFMVQTGNKFKVASRGRDKVWNLIGKRFEFDGIFRY